MHFRLKLELVLGVSCLFAMLAGCDKVSEFAEQAQKQVNDATASSATPANSVAPADSMTPEPVPNPARPDESASVQTIPNVPPPEPMPTPVDRLRLAEQFMNSAPEAYTDKDFLALDSFSTDELSSITKLVIATANVTHEGLAVAQKFPALTSLSLKGMSITPPMLAAVAQCAALEELSLQECTIDDAAMRELVPLVHLKSIDLSKSNVTDAGLEVIPRLADLEVLRVAKTMVTGATLLGKPKLSKLRILDISDSAFGPGLAYFRGLETLEELHANGARIDEQMLGTSGIWPGLKMVNLYRAGVTDKSVMVALKNSKQLEVISLRGTSVSNRTLGMLQYCKNLKELNVSETQVNQVGGAALKKILPDAVIIW